MAILLVYPLDDVEHWEASLKQLNPHTKIYHYPSVPNAQDVDFIANWAILDIDYQQFPNLRMVTAFGAGVDHIIYNPTLPKWVDVTRVVDVDMRQQMSEYIIMAILQHRRCLTAYQVQQQNKQWKKAFVPDLDDQVVGIMGLGSLGQDLVVRLRALGLNVTGWSRLPKKMSGMTTFAGGDGLKPFLAQSQILVCLLPDTLSTHDILNQETFAQLPKGAYVINVARGGLLDEEDLLDALDSGQLSGVFLDVFKQEPLPKEHPFWTHPKVILTPHISSNPVLKNSVVQISENYQRMMKGLPLIHAVNRAVGY